MIRMLQGIYILFTTTVLLIYMMFPGGLSWFDPSTILALLIGQFVLSGILMARGLDDWNWPNGR
jgi:hypothetical protein